jgi:hypothetical protein
VITTKARDLLSLALLVFKPKEVSTMSDVRQATNKLLEMVEHELLDRDQVIMACVKYMSESDVADMCQANEFFLEDDEQ